jgi:ribonuclease D
MRDLGIITSTAQLSETIQLVRRSPWCALDTEFMREKTYFPQLCLIQIATAELIFCIDPLAVRDISPLADLLADPAVEKVIHSATQDIEVLLLGTGVIPKPVFDTQIAASLLGYGDQMSYAQLVARLLALEIDKSQSRTDWSRRPMSPEQLQYARDDVRHLAALYPILRSELETRQRLGWMQEEIEPALQPENYRPSPRNAWLRVSGHRRLRSQELAVLRELAAWRELEAGNRNRPRRWIMSDDSLLRIARLASETTSLLQQGTGWDDRLTQQCAEAIIAAVQEAKRIPPDAWPEPAPTRKLTAEQETRLASAVQTLNEIAQREHVCSERLASRRDVVTWLFPPEHPSQNARETALERPSRLCCGWRAELTKDLLLESYPTLRSEANPDNPSMPGPEQT